MSTQMIDMTGWSGHDVQVFFKGYTRAAQESRRDGVWRWVALGNDGNVDIYEGFRPRSMSGIKTLVEVTV